jgi:bifunctional non-homologous end joining protein LigD
VAKTIPKKPSGQPDRFIEPMQSMAVAKLPDGPIWEYEIKFDGYRALGIRSGGCMRLISRNGNDFSARFPSVARALAKLPDDTVVDGEIVALDESGRPSFNVLQNYKHSDTPLQFYAFDLLHLAGRNLCDRPLDERRELLRTKVMPRMADQIRFSESFEASPADLISAAKKQGLEGIIAKRRDSLYEPGRRSGAWVKMRVNKGQELVVGGYVPPGKTSTRSSSDIMKTITSSMSHACATASCRRYELSFSSVSACSKSRPVLFRICPSAARAAGVKVSRPTRLQNVAG